MRYVLAPSLEDVEPDLLREFGKSYAPSGPVTLDAGSRVAAPGLVLVNVLGETLAIHPDTASWAFVDPDEARVLRAVSGDELTALQARTGADRGGLHSFVGEAYRRGLVTVQGQRSLSDDMFADSPNVDEGHLVELLLTERCNLGCTYCLAGTTPRMPVMTPLTGRRVIDLAWRMPADTVTFEFSGGEPFMRFELMRDLVAYARDHPDRMGRSAYFAVQTNATLLNRRRVEWLRDNEVTVGVSLDGDPASHDVSRPTVDGRGSWRTVLTGLDLLDAVGVPYGILVVLNRSNVDRVDALLDFVADRGVESLKVNPVGFLGTARSSWEDVGLGQDEVVAYFQELLHRLVPWGRPLHEDNLWTMMQHIMSKRRPTRCMRSHCGAGDTFQTVSADGSVYPCGRATQTPRLALGSVHDDVASLDAPARSSLLIGQIRTRRPDGLEGCSTCEYRQLCQAGCSAQAMERYGTVRHRTPECHFFKTMYPWLMHRITFDDAARSWLNGAGYLGGGAVSVRSNTLRPAAATAR